MSPPIQREISTIPKPPITYRVYEPQNQNNGTVLIASAMGVAQDFYADFANWLAANGFMAITFDYRGMGLSRKGHLRDYKLNILDWAKIDCATMIDTAAELNPDKPLYWVGHSLGGQILGFVPNISKVSKAIIISSGSGYWRENSPPLKRKVWLLWYLVGPAATFLFGYFPGKALHMVGDLPKGVFFQWRRWCLNPHYVVGVEGPYAHNAYAALQIPIVSLSFSDDEFMSQSNIESLLSLYPNAPKTHIRLTPEEVGMKKIGHFGFFKEKWCLELWKNHIMPHLNTK